MVNKSASLIGTLLFKNGNKTVLWIGANSNTGDTIVWQATNGSRSQRVTGKNISKLAEQLEFVIREGEARWDGKINNAALDSLRASA